MIIRKEDVIGVQVSEKFLCLDCVSDEDYANAEAKDFMVEDDNRDEDLIFCDACNKRIV